MKIFVINLKSDVKRLQRILTQFKKFNIVDFEIVEAINGRQLSESQINQHYDKNAASFIIRELGPTEIACALSHIEVCNRIIKYNKRCLVIEDDVLLTKEFKNFVNIEIDDSSDIIFFGLYTSNCEYKKPKLYQYKNIRYSINHAGNITRCYLEKSYTTLGGINFYDIDEHSVKHDIFHGTHAYAPSVNACHKIIKSNYPVKMMADYVWVSSNLSFKISKHNIIEVDHSLQSNITSDRDKAIARSTYSELYMNRVNNIYHNK